MKDEAKKKKDHEEREEKTGGDRTRAKEYAEGGTQPGREARGAGRNTEESGGSCASSEEDVDEDEDELGDGSGSSVTCFGGKSVGRYSQGGLCSGHGVEAQRWILVGPGARLLLPSVHRTIP